MTPRLAVLFLSVFLTGNSCWAIEMTSLRVKALGESLQGLVPDDYTDVLSNPARERFWRSRSVIAKAGVSGNPLSIGFVGGRLPLFLLAEGKYSRASSASPSLSSSPSGNRFYRYQSLSENKERDYSGDLLLVSGFGGPRFGMGLGLLLEKHFNEVRNSVLSNNQLINMSSGSLVYQSESEKTSKDRSRSIGPTLLLGLHWQGKRKERELILKTVRTREDSLSSELSTTFRDNDPDNNGRDQYEFNITTPSTSQTTIESRTETNPTAKTGGGFEYHSRLITQEKRKGFLFSFLWEPFRMNEESVESAKSTTLLGSTTTSSSIGYNKTAEITQNRVTLDYGHSYMAHLHPRLWLGTGLRATLTYNRIKQTFKGIDVSNFPVRGTTYMTDSSFKAALPVFVEVPFTDSLTFRANATGHWIMTETEHLMDNQYFYSLSSSRILKSTDSRTSATYGLGFGYQWETLKTDVFTTSDILDASNWQVQLSYAF